MPEEDADSYKKLVIEICSAIGKESICIKKHPRDRSSYGEGYIEYPDRTMPFERILMHSDMKNKTLIALSSTSVFTPKILFNEEPYLVLLYKLFSFKNADGGRRDRLYSEITAIYRDKEKVFIPESREELYSVLNKIRKRIDDHS